MFLFPATQSNDVAVAVTCSALLFHATLHWFKTENIPFCMHLRTNWAYFFFSLPTVELLLYMQHDSCLILSQHNPFLDVWIKHLGTFLRGLPLEHMQEETWGIPASPGWSTHSVKSQLFTVYFSSSPTPDGGSIQGFLTEDPCTFIKQLQMFNSSSN